MRRLKPRRAVARGLESRCTRRFAIAMGVPSKPLDRLETGARRLAALLIREMTTALC
jgi:hypothetical protein